MKILEKDYAMEKRLNDDLVSRYHKAMFALRNFRDLIPVKTSMNRIRSQTNEAILSIDFTAEQLRKALEEED